MQRHILGIEDRECRAISMAYSLLAAYSTRPSAFMTRIQKGEINSSQLELKYRIAGRLLGHNFGQVALELWNRTGRDSAPLN